MPLFSRLGLILVGIQTLLTVLIPIFAKIFPSSCSIICIFTEEQVYFFLFNLPGNYITSIPFINEFIKHLGTQEQQLSGKITIFHYISIFLSASIIYYFMGLIIEAIFRKMSIRFENKKKSAIVIVVCFFLGLILFVVLSESFIRIADKVGDRIEQLQRCKNKNGFNTYEWMTVKSEFYCKNGLYDGSYKVYRNGVPDVEYTYKNGTMICEKQYRCGKDLTEHSF